MPLSDFELCSPSWSSSMISEDSEGNFNWGPYDPISLFSLSFRFFSGLSKILPLEAEVALNESGILSFE